MASTLKATTQESNALLHENKLMYIWGITNLLVIMNTTMFNVALPFILQDFSLDSATASWLVSGYSITFAISSLTFSRLSDFVPISRLLLWGMGIFAVGSFLGFLSYQFSMLLVTRILQAAGAGAMMGLAMIVAGRYIPITRRGKAMAIIGSTATLAFGLGPVLGGVVIQYVGWNYLFVITSIAVLFVPFILKLLPKETLKKGNFDLVGALLITLSVTGILLFVSTFSYFILVGSTLLFGITWMYLNKTKAPFVPPVLLKNKQFIKLTFIGGSNFFLNFSNLFLMPIILTTVFQKSPIVVGLFIFPGAIIAMVAGQVIGRYIDRYGNGRFILVGLLLLWIASVLFTWLTSFSAYFILFIYMFASVGFTILTTSISNEITRILPGDQLGSAIGVNQLFQLIGGAIGVSIAGLLLTLQDGFPSFVIYRNIFSCLTILITIAMVVYIFYRKESRVRGIG